MSVVLVGGGAGASGGICAGGVRVDVGGVGIGIGMGSRSSMLERVLQVALPSYSLVLAFVLAVFALLFLWLTYCAAQVSDQINMLLTW